MKKFLSDVLVDCNLTVSGTTSLGAATGVTVSDGDNSLALATTAWVTSHVSTNSIYSLSVPTGTTTIRLASASATDDVSITAAGATAVSRVSDSEIRITSTDSVDYISDVSLSGSTLSFTGVNSAFTGSLDLSAFSTQLTDIETVYAAVRNVSGVVIPKGTPLATVIGQTSGNVSDVVPADASDPAFMPALFIADEDIAEEAEGRAVAYGEITGIDTSLYPSGTTVYVAPGGGWTNIKPTGANLIQNLGVITKQHNTNGGGIVTGVGRSNDVPNIPQGYAWVGNANGVATPTLLGSLAYSSATYDNYGSWNLKTNGVQRTTVQSGGNLDIVAGTDISVSYGAGGVVTINSTATGSIDYVSDVALNGNSLDFTGTGNAFVGSIDLSSLNAASAIADLTDVDLTGLTNNAILKYDSVNQEWVVSTTNDTANATATAIVPFAIASVNTTSNGSGIGISWSNWNSSNATLDFTFTSPQPNTDYIVITDTEVFDDFFVGVTNKTVNGFRAEFYDSSQSRTPSSFSEFSFIVYASDPTQQIKSSVGGINELSDVDTVTSAPSNGEALVWDGTNWVPGTISTTNNYLTGLSFNTGNGILTATRQGLGDLTVDFDGRYLELSGGTLYKQTNTTGTSGTTFLTVHNNVGGDISQQQSFIDFMFTDTNANFTPQVRIGAQVGRDADANAISKEGAGAFVVYTGDGTDESGGGSLTEVMRVSYNGSMTVQNTIAALGGNSTQWNLAYGWGDHSLEGYLTTYNETDTLASVTDRGNSTTNSIIVGSVQLPANHSKSKIKLHGSVNDAHSIGTDSYQNTYGPGTWDLGTIAHTFYGSQNNILAQFGVGGTTQDSTSYVSGDFGIGTSNPQHKLDVAGNINSDGYYVIGGDDAARIAVGSGTGNPVPQEVASFGSSVHIGAFIDFTIYNEDKSAMRSGTMQLAFNADQVVFNEVSTMDIGDTTPCILNAVNNDGIVSVTFETPDPTFHIKYQVRTI